MSTETLKPEFGANRHPDENVLLLALERELPPAEAAEVERHIGTCWECRAKYHQMHRGILAFVEYRDKLYLPELDSAPGNFHRFPSVLNQAAAEASGMGLIRGIWSRVRSFFIFAAPGGQARWITATAAAMAVVVLWTQVLNPPTLAASEILTKAARQQNPSEIHRKVRQKVRIRTARAEVVREFQWETGSPIPGARWGTDPNNWIAPMTAEGFADWHDSLSARKDRVKKSGSYWTLDTIAPSGAIREASIVVRSGDFHPTEEHIHFSDNQSLDIEEVSFDMVSQAAAPVPAIVRPAQPLPARRSQDATPAVVAAPTVNLDETELELRYTMFAQHLDDEDLQITRTADGGAAVILSGIVSSAERQRQLQAALGGIPGVRLSISLPNSPSGTPITGAAPASQPQAPLMKDQLNAAFASGADRRDFVDSCLSAADSALSHAFAVKKLSDRYTDASRRALKPESQAKLDEMVHAHIEQILAENSKLDGILDLLSPAERQQAPTPANSRAGVAALFELVQQQDSLVAALVAGTRTPETVATASDKFRNVHGAIARLAGEIVQK
jgi:hypothetical protein